MFDNLFIWAQVVGFLAMAMSTVPLQLKNPRHIILCNVPISILWGIQFIMLGAPLGAIINLCSMFKDFGLGLGKQKHIGYFVGAYIFIIWVFGLYFFEFWYDIFPLIGATSINLILIQRDNRPLIARGTIICCLFWMIYNVIVGSWMGAICGVLVIASSIIGMYRHEGWNLGKCYKSFVPSLARSLFAFPNLKTYP